MRVTFVSGLCCAAFVAVCALPSNAQSLSPSDQPAAAPDAAAAPAPIAPVPPAPTPAPQTEQDKRVFGVLPNYRTAPGDIEFQPITAAQKLTIASKDSFDWPGFLVAGAFSLWYQEQNQNPSFGQGVKGYVHRYVTSYADQVVGNFLTEGVLPSVLHEDPRYFRLGKGSTIHRVFYAATRVLVTRTDAGGSRFNFSEVLGNGISASLGNAYYPDNRGFDDTMERMVLAIGTDSASNLLKEFWPDVKARVFRKHGLAPASSGR